MKVSDFSFQLPDELIARYPLPERAASRLLCLDRDNGALDHGSFSDLPDLLLPGDLLVFNDTRVIPARLFGRKATGGRLEILIERVLDETEVLAHIRSSKSPGAGQVLHLDDGPDIAVLGRRDALFHLRFPEPVLPVLQRIGHIPLPPYMERGDDLADRERYQTVYARREGAVAAPTAGLHFDDGLFARLDSRGIERTFVTLHVGAGTFQPVRVENVTDHQMHSEYLEVSDEAVAAVERTKARGGRVVAVGTTSVRSLETASASGRLQPYQGETDIFIYPGYRFLCIDAMITNFHLPESTLIMLVSAFAGRDPVMRAYEEAIRQRYRFYSYGDAMLIAPHLIRSGAAADGKPSDD